MDNRDTRSHPADGASRTAPGQPAQDPFARLRSWWFWIVLAALLADEAAVRAAVDPVPVDTVPRIRPAAAMTTASGP